MLHALTALQQQESLKIVFIYQFLSCGFLALYHALKDQAPSSALFGSAISVAGLVVVAVGALPHIALSQLHDLYYASSATPDDQATIILLWQSTWAIFDAILIAGLSFMPLAFLSFGLALRNHSNFGTVYAGLSFVLSILGFAAISISMVDPNSPSAAIIVFGLIIFHFVLGWKLYNLSR